MNMQEAVSAAKEEIFLKDYTPPLFTVEKVDLTFQLDGAVAVVTAKSLLRRQGSHTEALKLDGGPYMTLERVSIDGRLLSESDYQLSADSLTLDTDANVFELEVVTRLNPHENTRLEGLYHSGGNYCTQCEAEGFRHITYYQDRPDILARYRVRIEADKASFPVLLSNGNRMEAGDLPGGKHYAVWDDPHPKPSYLFALVAGNLACIKDSFTTMSGNEVELCIYVRSEDVTRADYAMGSLKRAMVWDEEVYGLEYDLEVYNIVAVSDFNMGAMENKGLNVFNTRYVLASPETATDADFSHVEGVIGHEYFHNWTGNRVTCRDWFQLSLKEGLTVFRDQEFTSDMASRALKRLDDVRVLRLLQFAEDAGPLAHPVRPESYIEINNFYTMTVYNKGAEVIRMMHTFLGADAFRKGMDLYFERYDGQAVTCEDFVCAMEDASGVDLKQFRLWYSQAGTPVLKVKRARVGKKVSLTIDQRCGATPGQPTKQPYHMPFLLGWLDADGAAITPEIMQGEGAWKGDTCTLQIRNSKETITFDNVPEGATVSLHRGFSAPVRLEHDLSNEELAFLMAYDTDAYARWEAAQMLATRLIIAAVDGKKQDDTTLVYKAAFGKALEDRETDPALLAELIALPSEIDIGQQMPVLVAQKIHDVREALVRDLASTNIDRIKERYDDLSLGEYSLDSASVGRRRLKNTLLGYMAAFGETEQVRRQYFAASNMTDRMAALQLATNDQGPLRDEILSHFYTEWQDNALVIDKWFAAQALSKRTDTLECVRGLIEHPDFSFKNPNRLRSVVSSFSMANQAAFHRVGGEGYRFLKDMILTVDKYNPQTAARLVAPLGRWQRVGSVAADQMKKALKEILDTASTSDDVRELCLKSLE